MVFYAYLSLFQISSSTTCGCTPGLAHRNDYGLKVRGAGLCRVMGRGVHPFLPLLCFPSSFVFLLLLLSLFLELFSTLFFRPSLVPIELNARLTIHIATHLPLYRTYMYIKKNLCEYERVD